MTENQEWQRKTALASSGGVCEVCGKPLLAMQGAHRIANTKANREKYGSFVIDDTENIAIVCSLKCNDSCNIGNNPGKCLALIRRIIDRELKKFGGERP